MAISPTASATTDLTTCSICHDMHDNPKSLPCLHAFCLHCLQGHFKDKCPGEQVPCPVCRRLFHIPSKGLGGLQHHFIVQRLVDARRSESGEESDEVPCEVCLKESEEGSDQIRTVTMYCIDCRQMLCDQCSGPHGRSEDGSHRLKALTTETEQELIHLRVQGSSCNIHKDKQVESYCHDCNENICQMCIADEHRNHSSGEIPKVADNFRLRMNDDDKQIQSVTNAVCQQLEQIRRVLAEFLKNTEDVKKIVLATGDIVKRPVDSQINAVLMELQSVTSESAKQAESVQKAYQLALMSLESFHVDLQQLLDKGRPSDITRAACELHDRATELLNNDFTAVKYRPPHVTFTPADVTQVKRLNLIGKLTVRTEEQPAQSLESEQKKDDQQLKQASDRAAVLQEELIQAADRERQLQMQLDKMKDDVIQLQTRLEHQSKEFDDFKLRSVRLWEQEMEKREMGHVIETLPKKEPVCGMTSLDNRLYVLRGNKSTKQIEVYDMETFCLLDFWTVPGLGNYRATEDIVACGHNLCAYVSDASHKSVHRVALSDATVTDWPVNDRPAGLSLTYRHGVLVSCDNVRKIKEFSTDGQLLHVLTLPQDAVTPLHTIQLSGGQLIVCHGADDDPFHCVCSMGSDGSVVKSFGGPKGSGSQHINTPAHMAVDRNEFVFVVDVNNCRVLLLSPLLTYVRDVVSRKQFKWFPVRVHLDSDRWRLYVAENEFKNGKWAAGRVVVFSV